MVPMLTESSVTSWNFSNISLEYGLYSAASGVGKYNQSEMYIFGGTAEFSTYQYKILKFDFKSIDTLNQETPNTINMMAQAYTSTNGIVYISPARAPLAPFQAFDIARRYWLPYIPFNDMAMYPCIANNETHLFVATGDMFGYICIYNINNGTWTNKTLPAMFRSFYSSCLVYDDHIYVFGGVFYESSFPNNGMDLIIDYDIINNKWKHINNLNVGRLFSRAVMPYNNGKIYIIGGANNDTTPSKYFDTVELFDAKTNNVSMQQALLIPTVGTMVEFINNRIVVFAGKYADKDNTSIHYAGRRIQISNPIYQ